MANVSNTGLVTGIGAGTANFIFRDTTTGCFSEPSEAILVEANQDILISGNSDICLGDSSLLVASVIGGNWSSANTSIAIVDSTGRVTAMSVGNTDIIYTPGNNGCYNIATRSITVHSIPCGRR